MQIRCNNKRCEYEWDYRGKSKFYATCPRCLRKVNVNVMKGGLKKDGTKT